MGVYDPKDFILSYDSSSIWYYKRYSLIPNGHFNQLLLLRTAADAFTVANLDYD